MKICLEFHCRVGGVRRKRRRVHVGVWEREHLKKWNGVVWCGDPIKWPWGRWRPAWIQLFTFFLGGFNLLLYFVLMFFYQLLSSATLNWNWYTYSSSIWYYWISNNAVAVGEGHLSLHSSISLSFSQAIFFLFLFFYS